MAVSQNVLARAPVARHSRVTPQWLTGYALAAPALLLMLVIFLLFVWFAQGYLVKGLVAGAVRG